IDDSVAPSPPLPFDRGGRPALSHDGHYPPRPDAARDPAGAALWQQLVTSDPVVIAPNAIAEDVHHSTNTTSGNWSGYVLTSAATAPIYAWIYGEWNVPRAYAESGFYSSDHSSLWVGIDGWGSSDVVQDGTDQNTLTLFWIQSSSYDAWVEWYPLSAQAISNLPVNPGDRVHSWTLLKDASGNYSAHPTVGWFYMWNQTQNVYTYASIDLPAGATFSGHSAEWVLERPTVSGSTSSLANYATAQLTNASTYDLWGGSHQYAGDASDRSWNVTMTGTGGAVLSTVAPVNASTMQFTWHGHQ
ncbi:MAG: G1 family glutamic endopeptidase, partial [Acidobacteriota bacterium]